jgi:hypothetical protein
MTTPTGDTGRPTDDRSTDDRSMAERVIDRVTGRDHDDHDSSDESAAAARRAAQARQDEQDRANLGTDDPGRDDRVGTVPDRTGLFRPATPVAPVPAEPVGGEVTGDDLPADRTRPAWPGPSAASSVGQAGPPAPEKDPADRTAWAGPTAAGSGEDPGSHVYSLPDADSTPQADSTPHAESATGPDSAPNPDSGDDQTSRAIPTSGRATGTATPGSSEDPAGRPVDPSVREDYVHADADRRATSGRLDDVDTAVVTAVDTKNDVTAKDDVDVKDSVDTSTVDTKDGVDGADATSPSPVTSITGGRRRSEAAPDAVHGVTDVTPDSEWRDLQAKFVDDPEATVSEAATLIERDLAGLRSKLAGGDTEYLRNAFKRYRSLHESLR